MNKHILAEKSRAASSSEPVSVATHISNCIGRIFENLPEALTGERRNAASVSRPARSSTYQFAHAALLSHPILALVVEAHLAGFAAEAVLRRVSRQEHNVLGRRT